MLKNDLYAKLQEIYQAITEKYQHETDTGVLVGSSGLTLFLFYYSRLVQDDQYSDVASDILMECLEKMNNGYNYPTYCTGISGMAWVIDHLEQEGFIDNDNDDLLSPMDTYLHSEMMRNMQLKNYDFLHGAIGIAYYFLNRYRNTKSDALKQQYSNYVVEVIDLLDSYSIKEKETIKWLTILNYETNEKAYNLSLSHGMASFLKFFCKLHKFEAFRSKVEPLLRGNAKYLLEQKNREDNPYSMFPNWVSDEGEVSKYSRLSWCYGDLGIALALWEAAGCLEDETMKKEVLTIFEHAAKRTSYEDSRIMDPGICHGSFGAAKIFNRIYRETGDEQFLETSRFWIEDGLKMAIHEDGYAGFKKWKAKEEIWQSDLTLLEGVAGIGLSMIDFLSDQDNTWDECLMLN